MHLSAKHRFIIGAAILFLCGHALFDVFFPNVSWPSTTVFFLVACLGALAACLRRTWIAGPAARLNWILLCAGLLCWLAGTIIALRNSLAQATLNSATFGDFLYFFYGVPILLAVSSPDKSRMSPLFFLLDGVQAVVAGVLAYVVMFSVLPFSGATPQPMATPPLVMTYNLENILLAAGAIVRLLAGSEDAEEFQFFQILAVFLVVYAASAGIYNHFVLTGTDLGLLDVLVDLPFAAVAVAAVVLPTVVLAPKALIRRKPVELFIDNARPAMFAMALVILGVVIARRHYAVGMAATIFSLAIYSLRSTILQGWYQRSQEALHETKQKLEELSLQDGLTGVANRRCFDQRLMLEWARAARAQAPLSLLMIDIDFFKNLNDTFGHRAGDECLTQVGHALRESLTRVSDMLARYGGEEFVALLPGTDEEGAAAVARRMRTDVATLGIENPSSIGRHVTISIGTSTYAAPWRGTAADLIETSDRALYMAKQQGRNCTRALPIEVRNRTRAAS